MHAARILGHVAADRADRLARRVGRVKKAVSLDRFRNLQVAHARLDGRGAPRDVDVADALHPGEHDQDAVAVRDRPAGNAGARAAGDERHAEVAARLHDRAHLLLGVRDDGEHRRLAMRDERVGLERLQSFLVVDHEERRLDRPQGREDAIAYARALVGMHPKCGSPGCGKAPPFTRIAPYSAQRCSVGTALPGFKSPSGSNAALTAGNVARSAGRNWLHIWLIFSMPTPCSPVIVPPTSMHSSRMSAANLSVVSRSPGMLAS